MFRLGDLQSDPACRQDGAELTVREERNGSLDGEDSGDEPIGSLGHLRRCLAARTAVATYAPIGTFDADLGASAAFIGAVIPFR